MPIIEVASNWRFCWKPGDRRADVIHVPTGEVVDTVQVGDYDWNAGRSLATADDLEEAVHDWLDSDATAARETVSRRVRGH